MNGSETDNREGTWPVLCRIWARDYEAQIVVSMLQDAGIDAMLDCDPRGPMYFYYFPFGSAAPTPIYVPEGQIELARELMKAQLVDDPWLDADISTFESMSAQTERRRRAVFTVWLLSSAVGIIALLFGLLTRVTSRKPRQTGEA